MFRRQILGNDVYIKIQAVAECVGNRLRYCDVMTYQS